MTDAGAALENFLIEKVSLFLLGNLRGLEGMQRNLATSDSLQILSGESKIKAMEIPYLTVFFADFSRPESVQQMVRVLTWLSSPLVVKLVCDLSGKPVPKPLQLLCKDLGVQHLVSGPNREPDIIEKINLSAYQAQQVGSFSYYHLLLAKANESQDRVEIENHLEKFGKLEVNPDNYSLRVQCYTYLGQQNLAMYTLKRMLNLYPQDLNAAHRLFQMYVRGGKIAQAIEIGERLCHIQDLNSERTLALGNLYLGLRNAKAALEKFRRGQQQCNGADPRFRMGIAKVCMMIGDYKRAVETFGNQVFNKDLIAFLNRYGALLAKTGDMKKALEAITQADQRVEKTSPLLATVKFNLGLLQFRAKQWVHALKSFEACEAAKEESFKNPDLSRVKQLAQRLTKEESAVSDPAFKEILQLPLIV